MSLEILRQAQNTATAAQNTVDTIILTGKEWVQSNVTSGSFRDIAYNNVWVAVSNSNGFYYSVRKAVYYSDLISHDENPTAHSDIRQLITALEERITALETLEAAE